MESLNCSKLACLVNHRSKFRLLLNLNISLMSWGNSKLSRSPIFFFSYLFSIWIFVTQNTINVDSEWIWRQQIKGHLIHLVSFSFFLFFFFFFFKCLNWLFIGKFFFSLYSHLEMPKPSEMTTAADLANTSRLHLAVGTTSLVLIWRPIY